MGKEKKTNIIDIPLLNFVQFYKKVILIKFRHDDDFRCYVMVKKSKNG